MRGAGGGVGGDGILYVADLAAGVAASAVQRAQDFELGEGLDVDGDGAADTCLVAFRTPEADLAGPSNAVGNRDGDTDDLAMFLYGADSIVTDCTSSTTDCPGQACRQFNYQAGRESVLSSWTRPKRTSAWRMPAPSAPT